MCCVERAGDHLDRAGRDLVAVLDQLGQLVDHAASGVDVDVLALERQHVAAQVHGAVEMVFERLEHGVLGAGQFGGDAVVELDRGARQEVRCSLTAA